MWSYTPYSVFIESFACGDDLYHSILEAFPPDGPVMGCFFAIGAVQNARISFYDQENRVYRPLSINKPAEILSCMGNISLLEGKPFVHAHITLGFDNGHTAGGHLMEGTIVYACEFHGMVLGGKCLERRYDPRTGLNLWQD